jgi:hypothetical protein
MQTYWLELEHRVNSTTYHRTSTVIQKESRPMTIKAIGIECYQPASVEACDDAAFRMDDNILRKINWNVEVLKGLLLQILERRRPVARYDEKRQQQIDEQQHQHQIRPKPNETFQERVAGKMIIHEVQEIITLPLYDPRLDRFNHNPHHQNGRIPPHHHETDKAPIKLDPKVLEQLESFVTEIASLYRNNPCKFYIVQDETFPTIPDL